MKIMIIKEINDPFIHLANGFRGPTMCQAPPLEVYSSWEDGELVESYRIIKEQKSVHMVFNTNGKYFKMLGNVLNPLAEYGPVEFLFSERILFLLF